jgi:hypothetical protein
MWPLKQEIFLGFLDALQARRDRGDLWIADHISQHQYETERDTARVEVTARGPKDIHLQLKCSADPRFYDLPLTLVTKVPGDWEQAKVTQGERIISVAVDKGTIRFDALPGTAPIKIKRGPAQSRK